MLLGLCTGYAGYRAMRALDDYPVEVLITLSVVTGTYAVAQMFGTSGPLAVVAAGLLIGDLGAARCHERPHARLCEGRCGS